MKSSIALAISNDDLRELFATRIELDERVPDTLRKLAELFNEQLQLFLQHLKEYFQCPDITIDSIDFHELRELGRQREALKFQMLQAMLKLLAHRAEVHEAIQNGLTANGAEARRAFDRTYSEVESRLRADYEDQQHLERAVHNTIHVKNAERTKAIALSFVAAMNTAPNMNLGAVTRLHERWKQRVRIWVADIACIEQLPELDDDESAFWTHAG